MHISIALKSEKFLTLGEKPTISIDPPPAESELGPKPFLRVHPGLGVVRWFFGQLAPGDLESNGYAHTVASSL